ncbi:MAG: YeiH family protein [Clostridia bacterium]|nr:YeiH family protein [Clostridia bacterium]
MKKILKFVPGAALALVIAAVAKLLEMLEEKAGLHFIGASVIALFIGMIVNAFFKPNDVTAPGIKFTSKKILKFAIVLLGASLNIKTVLTVGKFSLTVMLFTLATCFGLGALIGKLLGLNWKTSSLINAGTGICGGSAIAAIAPVIEATDMDIAYGMSATFLFDMVMIVVFPIFGRLLGLSDAAFGLWAGTAVNDTSSVVATGYAFSEAAGDFATMVKLTRTLAIIPAVLVFAAINIHLKKKAQKDGSAVKVNLKSVFPWFILAFLAMSGLTSLGLIPEAAASVLKNISKFLMVAALGAIGLNTDFKTLFKSGAKPMLHGFIISLLVVLVAIGVEYMIGVAPTGTLM